MRLIRMLPAVALGLAAAGCSRQNAAPPSASLTEQEIVEATSVLRSAGLLGDSVTVASLTLAEPPKGDSTFVSTRRQAEARLFDRAQNLLTDVVVDLAPARIASRVSHPGAFPRLARRDGTAAARMLVRDARWRSALARRKLRTEDVALVQMGPGVLDEPWVESGHRYVRVVAYTRTGDEIRAPVEGLVGVADLTAMKVAEVVDAEVAPPPLDRDSAAARAPARPRHPIRVAQPSRNYRVNGSSVTWLGWEFRFAMHPREGLVLHDVGFAPEGQSPRRILARASLAEMLVPYGDPSRAWSFRSIFDAGEHGMGHEAATLVPGGDLPANAERFDAVMADDDGQPVRRVGLTGIYERDGGLRWRHEGTAVRAQELVMRFAATVGNYDYGFSWVFSQDGTLAMEIDLTGLLLAKGVHRADPRFGAAVEPHLAAVHHQHFFNFRLDFDVQGAHNRVREVETAALPMDSTNPHGTAFEMRSTVLDREQAAVRDLVASRSRTWIVENPRLRDSLGGHPGYVFVPAGLPDLLTAPAARLAGRGTFARHALWVTVHKKGERYPAGEFPGQDPGGAGLPAFIADDESIDDADVVVWYTVGSTHLPRPEEWPIMPVHRMRFELRPVHFLTRPMPVKPTR